VRPDFARLRALDADRVRQRSPNLERNLRIVEALRQEAIALGKWPPADPLEGIEVDIRLARVLNTPPRRNAQ
jgi:hypothetical protein